MNIISVLANDIKELIKTLEEKNEMVMHWFKTNNVTVKPNNFVVNGCSKTKLSRLDTYPVKNRNQNVNSEAIIELLGTDSSN